MKFVRLLTLILPLLLAACVPEQAAGTSPESTSVTTHDKDSKPFLRIQFDVDANGRVQNIQVLESTITPEMEKQTISKIKNDWRYEKNKPGTGLRIGIVFRPIQAVASQ